ncbi:hypothetical protein AMAG_12396 [Allomyces macrogynus ATCC 38327]|uniref:Uncharacterized protein n=1 Tax=Allomyces macrogynus (strain ATCC 38327) TaxID=578462 RepID=A0A0L0SZ26_ALLM3|nr:hypothetical protein AMAG_12396 [Allomyces macrogynus ATCC 38327]|eukprot:KNE67660.1 hypothetical protein AMAG_12396 [Allomyces macrogynus ATCC 38327]
MGNRASLALAMGANAGVWAFSSSSSSPSASGQYARLIRSLEAEWPPQDLDQLRKNFLHFVIGSSATPIAPPLEGDLVYGRRGSILNHATVSRQAFLRFLADVPEDLALFLFASISSSFPTSSSSSGPPERRASWASPSGSEHSSSSANSRAGTGSPTKTISLRPTRARPALEPVYRAARRSARPSSSSSSPSRSRNRATSSPTSDTQAGPPVISYPAFLAFLTQFLHRVSLPDWGAPRLAPPTLFVKTTHLFFAQQGLGAATVTDNDATTFFLPDRRRSTGSAATGATELTATGGSNLVSTEEVFNILLGTLWMWAVVMTPAVPPHAAAPTPPPVPPNVPSTLRSPLPGGPAPLATSTRTTSIVAGSSVRAASILSDGFGGGGGYASVSDMAAWRSSTLASHEIETRTMRAPYERDRSSLRPLRSISFDGGSSNVILDESVSWADSDQAATATMGRPSVLTEEIEESSVSDQLTTTSTALPVSPTSGGGAGGGGAPQSVSESSDAHSRRSLRAASLTSTTAVYHMRIDPEDAVSHFSARPQPNATDRWSVRTSLTAPTAPRATLPPPVVMAGGMATSGTGGANSPTSIPMFRLVEPHAIRDLANRILHLASKPASDSTTTTTTTTMTSDTGSRSSSTPLPTARPHATMSTVTAILARSLPYLYTCSFYPFLRARFVADTGTDAPSSPPTTTPSPLLQTRPDVHFLLHAAFPSWPTASLAFRAAVHGFSVSKLTNATRGAAATIVLLTAAMPVPGVTDPDTLVVAIHSAPTGCTNSRDRRAAGVLPGASCSGQFRGLAVECRWVGTRALVVAAGGADVAAGWGWGGRVGLAV